MTHKSIQPHKIVLTHNMNNPKQNIGNPNSHTPDKSLVREAFNGLALAVVQSVRPAVGAVKMPSSAPVAVTVSVSSPGLTGGSVSISMLPSAGVAEFIL